MKVTHSYPQILRVWYRSKRVLEQGMTSSFEIGAQVIRDVVANLGSGAGVYRMLDEHANVLYVGKARNLKNRVSNYISTSGLNRRIMTMVGHTRSMEIVETATEAEALLLEANLIKKLKPRYNILLRDDKSFPYILLREDHEFPQIQKHRGAQKTKGTYFGPFANAGAVNQTITTLQRAFLLRPCTDHVFANRTRPCLQYQIKRCSAPCVDYISKDAYGELMDQAKRFLSGKSRDIQETLKEQMLAASEAMDYEKAAELRNRISALTQVQQNQGFYAAGVSDADVFAMVREESATAIYVMFFRSGQYFGAQHFSPRVSSDYANESALAAFIAQFYTTRTPPKEIIYSEPIEAEEVLSEALSLKAEHKVSLFLPQRGDKKKLTDQALAAAKNALETKLRESMNEKTHLDNVQKPFGMDAPPEQIEVYDNSHIAGSYAVGAMVMAGPEGLNKNGYRRYNIKSETLEPGDDYAMMREVFTRRFSRLQKEDPDRTQGMWPDLVLIDGGQGQLTAVCEIFAELGVTDVTTVAISKGPDRNAGREQFHMPGREPFQLPVNDATLHYLQRLRDEVHRFAITSHRVKRSKALSKSELDDIPGIGATRKRALLHHFGSAKEVQRASLAELEKVEGISKTIAKQIYEYFLDS